MSRGSAGRAAASPLYLVVSAPSGAGKTSICRQVLKMCPQMRFSVSYTTRPPRPGEVDGRDYHFVSEADFRERLARGEFVEWAENYGKLYGTSGEAMKAMMAEGLDVMLDVEPRGAKALKARYPGGVFVFVLPPSMAELRKRLERRGFESPEVIAGRFEKARDEIREILCYDYIITNDNLEAAIDQLRAIYLAEKCRRERQGEALDAVLKNE